VSKEKQSALWSKGGERHPAVHDYIISRNPADAQLVEYDILGSKAHVNMLESVGLLAADEKLALFEAFDEVLTNYLLGVAAEKGIGSVQRILETDDHPLASLRAPAYARVKAAIEHATISTDETTGLPQLDLKQVAIWQEHAFRVDHSSEDVHSSVETEMTRRLGDLGKKIHTGRSRNDQILVDMRMVCRDRISDVQNSANRFVNTLLDFATKHEWVPMVGFTHTQPAMPSSVGQWSSSFAEALLDDMQSLAAVAKLNNQNPLGTAAGFGTGLPINRELTTELLGFDRVQINPMYAQLSRGKVEAAIISNLLQVMLTLDRVANDLVWFSSENFRWFKVPNSLTTGSSIMPQKRNLDIMEVLRANTAQMQAFQLQAQTVGLNLISGYNKDLKTTKSITLSAFELAESSLEITNLLFQHLEPVPENLAASFTTDVFATDEAYRLVLEEGMPFREAYAHIGTNLDSVSMPDDLVADLKKRTHLGSTGNLGIDRLRSRLNQA